MSKFFTNKKGLTLVEVLIAITVSAIVIGIGSYTFVSMQKNQEMTQNHIDLRQEANLIVTKLRTMHSEKNYKLCYDNGQIFINHMNSLASNHIKFTRNKNNTVFFENAGNEFTELKTCGNGNDFEVDVKKPLLVTLNIVDENNNSFEIDTVIDRRSMVINHNAPGNGGNDQDDNKEDEPGDGNGDNNGGDNDNKDDEQEGEYCKSYRGLNLFEKIWKFIECEIIPLIDGLIRWILDLFSDLEEFFKSIIRGILEAIFG